MPTTYKVFIIRNRKTGDHWVANSGKTCWGSVGKAKQSFKAGYSKEPGGPYLNNSRFDDQSLYEIVECIVP